MRELEVVRCLVVTEGWEGRGRGVRRAGELAGWRVRVLVSRRRWFERFDNDEGVRAGQNEMEDGVDDTVRIHLTLVVLTLRYSSLTLSHLPSPSLTSPTSPTLTHPHPHHSLHPPLPSLTLSSHSPPPHTLLPINLTHTHKQPKPARRSKGTKTHARTADAYTHTVTSLASSVHLPRPLHLFLLVLRSGWRVEGSGC